MPKPFHIAVLGPRGSGKTVFISSLFYACMHLPSPKASASFLNEDQERHAIMAIAASLRTPTEMTSQSFITANWKKLFDDQEFGNIAGTSCNWNLIMHWETSWQHQNLIFYDIPGGWFTEEQDWANEARHIKQRMEVCDAAFLILDTLSLVKGGFEYDQNLHLFIRALDELYQDKRKKLPVAVVFTKCDHPLAASIPLDKLIAKVQGIINRLEIKRTSRFLAKLSKNEEFKGFRVSAVGELFVDAGHPDGRPPKGGPTRNELFANLQHALRFLLEYPARYRRQVAYTATKLAAVLLLLGSLIWQIGAYRSWHRHALFLEKALQSPAHDLSLVTAVAAFAKKERPFLYDLLEKQQIRTIQDQYQNFYADWDLKYWHHILSHYPEPDNAVTLSPREYKAWQELLVTYLQYFVKFQERARDMLQTITGKIMAARLLDDERQGVLQPQVLLSEWNKVACLYPAIQEFARRQWEALLEKQVALVLAAFQQYHFPEQFLAETGLFLARLGIDELPPQLFAMLDEKIATALAKYEEEKSFEKGIIFVQSLKTRLPPSLRLPKGGKTLEQYYDQCLEKANQGYDNGDFHQIKNYLSKNAKVISLAEQIQVWQEHSQKFTKICRHKKEVENAIEQLQKQLEEDGYQKIEKWLQSGNRGNYDGLLKKIQILAQELPGMSRATLQRLERLKELTRRYEVEKDFQEFQNLIKGELDANLYPKAEQRASAFIENWRLKYNAYPEAEDIVEKQAKPLRHKIRDIWKKHNYQTIYEKFIKIQATSGIDECARMCSAFIREHGFDQDIDNCKNLLDKIRTSRQYTIKLLQGKHLANSWLAANLSVHVLVNGKKIFESKEYDTNTPTWNETFFVQWQAFDKVEMQILDTNGRNAWVYHDVSTELFSILILSGTRKNHLIEVSFEFTDAPTLILPSPEQKQWK